MRVVIAGLGSIGRRHVANLRDVEPSAHRIVWHQHSPPGVHNDQSSPSDSIVYSLDDALAQKPEAALITGPASSHVETGVALARHGVHLFIEKPLSNALDGVDELLETCRTNCLVLMIGYCFRFYRPLQLLRQAILDGQIGRLMSIRAEVGRYLPDWRPDRDYRDGVSAQRVLGGGVLLELSHELDYVRWLAGEVATISARVGRLGNLDIDVEDTAEVVLEFTSGAIGSVHLDMTQRSPTRSCRVVGTEGTLTWDGLTHEVRVYSAATGKWTQLHPANAAVYDEMYRVELRRFLDAVGGDEAGGATAYDGRRVLELALAARQASEERRVVAVSIKQ